jgi:ribosomal protein S18 acetylase RimI-like enzyme
MFVKPAFRKKKIGKGMLEQITELARTRGYRKIRLDTLPDMKEAQELYRLSGFYQIPSYRFNPVAGTVYMEKML